MDDPKTSTGKTRSRKNPIQTTSAVAPVVAELAVPLESVSEVAPEVVESIPDGTIVPPFLEQAVRLLYGELRNSTQALNRAAQVLALGESRIISIPFFDYPFRFRLPFVDVDRTMGAMLARCELPRALNLASLALRLPKGGVFVDGGGFVGASASFFSQVCRADEIHVFEPQKIILPCLEENLRMNEVRGLHLHNAALMDEAGPVNPGTFKAREIANTPYLKHRDGTYRGATIDGLNLERLDVIHLDFHGSKLFALTGASESIQRFKPFIVIDNEGRDHLEVSEFLKPMGYVIAALPTSFLFYPKVV